MLCTVIFFLAVNIFPFTCPPLQALSVSGKGDVLISRGCEAQNRHVVAKKGVTNVNQNVTQRRMLRDVHGQFPCQSCHLSGTQAIADPASAAHGARGCTGCHRGYERLFSHAMATRSPERRFAAQTWGQSDSRFFEKTCAGCHVKSCGDCHGGNGHAIRKPNIRDCLVCHKGYFVGTDYLGMAPREENRRYQRGPTPFGEPYLKMLPDIHAERGLDCSACHSMRSLAAGERSSKKCLDCHRPDPKVIEHGIAAHLEKLECAACHASWAPQEYGTFFLRLVDSPSKEEYNLRSINREWVKSVYLKKQDLPPLGLNRSGKVSPIRPEFIAYLSDIRSDRPVGRENRLLAAVWKAYAPHTIRRGTPLCDACHDDPRRFILEPSRDRIYELQRDGMTLGSFWDRTGQAVGNGAFLPAARYQSMAARTSSYQKAYVKKWQQFINRVDVSSRP